MSEINSLGEKINCPSDSHSFFYVYRTIVHFFNEKSLSDEFPNEKYRNYEFRNNIGEIAKLPVFQWRTEKLWISKWEMIKNVFFYIIIINMTHFLQKPMKWSIFLFFQGFSSSAALSICPQKIFRRSVESGVVGSIGRNSATIPKQLDSDAERSRCRKNAREKRETPTKAVKRTKENREVRKKKNRSTIAEENNWVISVVFFGNCCDRRARGVGHDEWNFCNWTRAPEVPDEI